MILCIELTHVASWIKSLCNFSCKCNGGNNDIINVIWAKHYFVSSIPFLMGIKELDTKESCLFLDLLMQCKQFCMQRNVLWLWRDKNLFLDETAPIPKQNRLRLPFTSYEFVGSVLLLEIQIHSMPRATCHNLCNPLSHWSIISVCNPSDYWDIFLKWLGESLKIQ